MPEISPKVTAAGITGILSAVVVTFVETKVPGLKGMDNYVQDFVTAAVSVGAGVVAGYVKNAEDWARRYVSRREQPTYPDLP